MTDFTIDDMINSVLEKQPDTFKDAFNSVMQAKIADAIEYKKQEVAQSMYSDEPDEEQEDENEEEYSEEDPAETED